MIVGDHSRNQHRGLTAVLGLVILIGIVAIASVSILLVAGETTTGMEQNAEIERIEGAFLEMSKELETASSSQDVERATELEVGDTGEVQTKATGTMVVAIGDTEIANSTLGTIEYTAADGTVIAYQGGGIWRGTGDESIALTTPNIHVSGQTLNLPILTVDSDEDHATDGPLRLSSENRTSTYSGMLGDDWGGENLTITVTTEYAQGWTQYFESMENSSVERHSVSSDVSEIEVTFNTAELPETLQAEEGQVTETLIGETESVISDPSQTSPNIEVPADFTEAVNVGESISISATTVHGTVSAGDDVMIESHDAVGDVHSEGDVTINHSLDGDIVAEGAVSLDGGAIVDGTIIAGGDVTAGGGATVTGDIVSYGDIDFGGGPSIGGECIATGEIAKPCAGGESPYLDPEDIDRHPSQYIDDTEHPAFDDEIEEMIATGEQSDAEFRTLTGGDVIDDPDTTHYIDSIDLTDGDQESLIIDVEDGSVDLVIRGDINSEQNAEIRVRNADSGHVVRLFTDGDISTGGRTLMCIESETGDCPDEENGDGHTERSANPLQVYGTSGSTYEFGQHSSFHGVLYAPESQIVADNYVDFFGTIVAGSFSGESDNTNFQYDETLEDLFEHPTDPTDEEFGPWMGALEGAITDAETGDTISNVTIDISGEDYSQTTNGSEYDATVPLGDYHVTVEADGYQTTTAVVTVDEGKRTTQDIHLASVLGSVSGTVTNASEPETTIEDVTVTLTDEHGTEIADETTAADGTYTFDVDPGEYTVSSEADGYVSHEGTIQVDEGEEFDLDFELSPTPDPQPVTTDDGLAYLHVTTSEVRLEG